MAETLLLFHQLPLQVSRIGGQGLVYGIATAPPQPPRKRLHYLYPNLNPKGRSLMHDFTPDPVLPIVIVPIEGGKEKEPRRSKPPDLRHWQIEEFLRQTGKSDNTQRTYRGQLLRFAGWCNKPWLEVTPLEWRRQQGGIFELVPKRSNQERDNFLLA